MKHIQYLVAWQHTCINKIGHDLEFDLPPIRHRPKSPNIRLHA